MSDVRCGALAAWARAWLAGAVSLEQVLDAVRGRDAPHEIAGLVGFEQVPLRDLLVTWRRSGGVPRCVLPVPGDVRGLPGPAAFRTAALGAGEAVVFGEPGRPGGAVVPAAIDYAPSSRPTTVLWQAYATDPVAPDHQSVVDSQYELTTAIRDTASALASADLARWRDGLAPQLQDARRAGEHVNLPPGYPARAVALLAQADRLQAVLDLAARDPIGGAVDRTGIAVRAVALRPLTIAVRRARVSAYNATVAD